MFVIKTNTSTNEIKTEFFMTLCFKVNDQFLQRYKIRKPKATKNYFTVALKKRTVGNNYFAGVTGK